MAELTRESFDSSFSDTGDMADAPRFAYSPRHQVSLTLWRSYTKSNKPKGGMIVPLTRCCNSTTKVDEDGEYCKLCKKNVEPNDYPSHIRYDYDEHPVDAAKKFYGPLEHFNSAVHDPPGRKLFDTVFQVQNAIKSGICRSCSTLRDVNGDCGCTDKSQ